MSGISRTRTGFPWRTATSAFAVALSLGCATTHRTAASANAATNNSVETTPAASLRPAEKKSTPYTANEYGFEFDKPQGDAWALATNVTSPEGRPIPVVVAHPESGAQIVVQVSEPVESPKALAAMLREKLETEASLDLTRPERLTVNSGTEAYGFNFAVKGEAKGRVAIIEVGDEIVLVVASWPEDADKGVVDQIDGIVKSVRAPKNTAKAMLRPDKA